MTDPFTTLDFEAARRRLEGVIGETPLVPFPSGDARVELRLKLECTQVTGAFKARGAWNQVACLTPEQRAAGVVTVSSGNHGKALAWAAERAGVRATIVMPGDAYPNKVQACRDHGAEVVLAPTRDAAEEACQARVRAGATLIHPYDALRTIEGAGTVGVELARQWPEVDAVIVPLGGGGLLSGTALALRRVLGARPKIAGVEPAGANKMTLALAKGEPVKLSRITTAVQGLCPPSVGKLTLEAVKRAVDHVATLEDDLILAAQRRLVREAGVVVEPAGAAAAALVLAGRLPAEWLAGRSDKTPLKTAVVVSGGNPAPDQLAAVRA